MKEEDQPIYAVFKKNHLVKTYSCIATAGNLARSIVGGRLIKYTPSHEILEKPIGRESYADTLVQVPAVAVAEVH